MLTIEADIYEYVRMSYVDKNILGPLVHMYCPWPFFFCIIQLDAERIGIRFELDEIHNGPNSEPYLEELIHQASYYSNTLGLPGICPEENVDKITRDELLVYLSSHFDPSRMVLTGVNVNHGQLVELAGQHFVGADTSWSGVEGRSIDNSLSQYTSADVKVSKEFL